MLRSRHACLRRMAQQHAPTLADNERLPANPDSFLQAFQVGLSTGHLQHLFSSIIHKDMQKQLLALTTLPQQRARLLSLAHKNPFPNLNPSDPLTRLHNEAVVINSRLHLGLPASALAAADPGARCICGKLLSEDIFHFGACRFFKGQQIACHDGAINAIVRELVACGVTPNLEHKFADTQKRVDISWVCQQTGAKQHIDFTVCNPAANSVATAVKLDSMTAMRPLQARENAKCTRHKAASNAEGYSFYPWVVDPFGSTTQTARKLVKQAVTTAAVYGSASAPNEKQFLARIAASVYLGTAAIYSAGLGSAKIHATQQHL